MKFVISDGIDIHTVVHYGRTISAHLRTALQFRDRCCVVPGCGRTFGLEYDHIVEVANGGATSLENLCRLCGPHHAMKTHKGYRISGSPGNWQWTAPGAGRPEVGRGEGAGVGEGGDASVSVRGAGVRGAGAGVGGGSGEAEKSGRANAVGEVERPEPARNAGSGLEDGRAGRQSGTRSELAARLF